VSDDEEPEVTFSTDATDISENGGVVTITASLSNPKLASTTVNVNLEGTSEKLIDYEVSSIYSYKEYAGSKNNPGISEGIGTNARFERPQLVTPYLDGSILVYDEGSYQIKKLTVKEWLLIS
jgi:histidinol phosphatase-like PHP family hydrolase